MSYHLTDGYHERSRPPRDTSTPWLLAGAGIVLGAAAYGFWQSQTRNRVGHRPPDSAPGRAARQRRYGRYAVAGRTVTIAKPRDELYAYWRDFSNLPRFMENVRAVEAAGDLTRWTIRAPLGRDVTVETRIVEDREGKLIAWRSTEASGIDTEGKVSFRDAPAGRGTEVEAIIAWVPPGGALGEWVAAAFAAEPSIQGRRELKRLKMLMEAGEIATNRNTKAA